MNSIATSLGIAFVLLSPPALAAGVDGGGAPPSATTPDDVTVVDAGAPSAAPLAPDGGAATEAPAPAPLPPPNPPPFQTEPPAPGTPIPPANPAQTPAVKAPGHKTPKLVDVLPRAGYVPGYQPGSLGMSPFVPRVGALPGGVTPGYHAPMPFSDFTFRWTGFLTASLQTSWNDRVLPAPGQSKTVFHVPPATIDEYGSFVGTSTMPGQWAQMNFVYGNRYVSANLTLTTWNPTDASTYYQIGSQQFINNMYLAYTLPPIAGIRVHALAGYFYNNYGGIGQYGLGMYTNAIVGGVRGVGEDIIAEYDVNDAVTLTVEDGLMGNRNGMGPIGINPTGVNGQGPIVWPSSWVHHLHAGVERKGTITVRAHLHYLTNWAQDDRIQQAQDNPTTRQLDESYVKDGRVQTYGFDASLSSGLWGYLGLAASYTQAHDAYPVKGIITFGGDGESLTNRWFGQSTFGTGQMVVAGVNYAASLGRILSYPVPFNTDGPDLAIQLGAIYAKSWSGDPLWDGRARYKAGADLLYTFLPYMAVGFRADAVIPNSHDGAETFGVISPRIVFKSDWNSRDTVQLIYGKWFYGRDTHPEASAITPGDRLDNQLFAINVQMWW
jgi:hypothetical protein